MSRRAVAAAALAGAGLAAGGCGGGGHLRREPIRVVTAPKVRRAPGLDVRTSPARVDGLVSVQRLVYTNRDGTTVPALFAVPRGWAARGCLIYENGLGSRKEDVAPLWPGAARVGLATFSIDLREHGERGTPASLTRAVDDPVRLAALVRGTVTDLRRAVDLLERQPACRHRIGYAGVSLGGIIGAQLVAGDRRVDSAALMSTPPTWRQVIDDTNLVLPSVDHHPARRARALRIMSPLDPDRAVGRIAPRPLLLMSGRSDPLVPPPAAAQLAAAARPPKQIVRYAGGHAPLAGAAALPNATRLGTFFARSVVDPTYAGR